MIEAGASINALAQKKVTALNLAAQKGHVKVLQVLIHHRAVDIPRHDGANAVFSAAWLGNYECLQLLLVSGYAPKHTFKGDSPLNMASWEGHADIVELLLLNGATFEPDLEKEMTPLHSATKKNRMGCARVLLKHGADPTLRDKVG